MASVSERETLKKPLRIVMAQQNMLVGDIAANTQRIMDCARQARLNDDADMIVFSELTLCGYPPEDLLLRDSLHQRIDKALNQLKTLKDIYIVVGVPSRGEQGLENQAVVIFQGEIIARHAKQLLPNYQVFDEKRYFVSGSQAGVFDCYGVKVGLSVCEDLWSSEVAAQLKEQKAEVILSLNASPFDLIKQQQRVQIIRERCIESNAAVIYVNQVGGQDELLFDGASFALNAAGELAVQAPSHEEGLFAMSYDRVHRTIIADTSPANAGRLTTLQTTEEEILYRSLVLSVRDYVNKNGFAGVVLGLSGGIDSALVLTIAVDALGPDRVEAVMMPSQYTSQMSREDAAQIAANLQVKYQTITIDNLVTTFTQTLADSFAGLPEDTTEENIQSRCRGVLLMALSNKKGLLLLSTGNKSEMAVGYATLYGDMAGGFNPLKDVYKTTVYQLANYRNKWAAEPVIPQRIIDRPPSAELKPDQQDTDSLPDYDILDQILTLYIEQDYSAIEIAKRMTAEHKSGKRHMLCDEAMIKKIIHLVDRNEYKRQQAPIGVRVTQRGFGKDRRYPLTFNWPVGE